MDLFIKSIDQVTHSDVVSFCELRIPENTSIDYKQALSGSKANEQVAKTVCAMANTYGGIALFGVSEKNEHGRGVPDVIEGVSPDTEQKVKQICLMHLYPPIIPEVASIEIPNSNSVLLLVRVRESDAVPHKVLLGGKKARVYIRANDISQPIELDSEAAPEQIEWLLERRKRPTELREALLERADRRCDTHTSSDRLGFSISPLYPARELWTKSELSEQFEKLKFNGAKNKGSAQDTLFYRDKNQWCFLYFELNQFGMLYFGREIQSEINVYELCHYTQTLMNICGSLYKESGFCGLADVRFRLSTGRFKIDLMEGEPAGGKHLIGDCIDKKVDLSVKLLATQLSEESSMHAVYSELLWVFGVHELALDVQETWSKHAKVCGRIYPKGLRLSLD